MFCTCLGAASTRTLRVRMGTGHRESTSQSAFTFQSRMMCFMLNVYRNFIWLRQCRISGEPQCEPHSCKPASHICAQAACALLPGIQKILTQKMAVSHPAKLATSCTGVSEEPGVTASCTFTAMSERALRPVMWLLLGAATDL